MIAANAPFTINVGGPNDRAHSLDIDAIHFLIGTPDDAVYHYWGYLGLLRLDQSRWIVADPDGDVTQRNLETDEIIPIGRDEEFPLLNRPFYRMNPNLEREELLRLRTRARLLANILGADATAPPGPQSTQWVFARQVWHGSGAKIPHATRALLHQRLENA